MRWEDEFTGSNVRFCPDLPVWYRFSCTTRRLLDLWPLQNSLQLWITPPVDNLFLCTVHISRICVWWYSTSFSCRWYPLQTVVRLPAIPIDITCVYPNILKINCNKSQCSCLEYLLCMPMIFRSCFSLCWWKRLRYETLVTEKSYVTYVCICVDVSSWVRVYVLCFSASYVYTYNNRYKAQ